MVRKNATKQPLVAVWWPGPPSKRKLKWMKKCDINFAHGNTMVQLRKLIPNAFDVPAGVDLEKFTKYNEENNEEKIEFIFVGRLISVKRLDFLIEAFNEAFKVNKNIKLKIVGSGTEKRKLQDLVNADIVFLGELYSEQLAKELSNSDIFCITSEYESFSMVTLEAMASFLPVIATRVGYLPNLVRNNGLLVELDNIEQLKDAILELAKNKEKRKVMGLNGRKRVENEFSWDKSAKQLEEIYEEFLK